MLPTDPPFVPPVSTLETERLSISIDSEQGYLARFRRSSDEELKQSLGVRNDEDLRRQKEKVIGGFSTYRSSIVFFHLRDRILDTVVGNLVLHNWFPAHCRAELGYAMPEEFRRMGYMKEALPAIVAFGFSTMNLRRIEAFISPQNIPSLRLVERLGFRREGLLTQHWCEHGVWSDSAVYGLLRSDFEQSSMSEAARNSIV